MVLEKKKTKRGKKKIVPKKEKPQEVFQSDVTVYNHCDGWGAFGHLVTYGVTKIEFLEKTQSGETVVVQTRDLCPMCYNSFLVKEANVSNWRAVR